MDNSGLVPMLRDNKVEDLQRMYRLFASPGKLELVWQGMAAYVQHAAHAARACLSHCVTLTIDAGCRRVWQVCGARGRGVGH